MSDFEGRGWRWNDTKTELGVERLPERKAVALTFTNAENQCNVLAYFRSDEDAALFRDWMSAILAPFKVD